MPRRQLNAKAMGDGSSAATESGLNHDIPSRPSPHMSQETVIGNDHPRDGQQWECQCARCGSSMDWHSCSWCDGEGITAPGELHEQDPLWYHPDDTEPCHQCGGEGSWPMCLSSEDWCKANPMQGRENIESGTPEWFVIPQIKQTAP